jgi:hypothetical protein
MDEVKKQMEYVLDGVFYLFGFTENPAAKPSKQVLDKNPSDKIKEDLKRVNADYRKSYQKMRNKALSVGQ